jgi:response regulator RpfG family c-di-GMP phosphodiesterase
MKQKTEILCVDDEPEVLEGLKLHLKRHFVVHLAGGGAEGLEVLRDNRQIAVILSDMRMPGMDGAKFLHSARAMAPDSVRMLLTGYSDMQSAIAAINEGQIFRFISKPCPPDHLLSAFRAAIAQHELIVAEHVLLQQTLLGCVESLARVLSVTKPAAFGRALRLRAKVRTVVDHLGLRNQWQIEAAAVLSQLGAVTLPEETLIKLNEGDELDGAERRELAASIETSVQMLENIPRLEPVLEILKYLALDARGQLPLGSTTGPPGALLLKLVLDWDRMEAQGCTHAEVIAGLARSEGTYGAELLVSLKDMPAAAGAQDAPHPTPVRSLLPGMILAEDLVRKNGVVILPRGFEIDRSLLDHVLAYAGEFGEGTVKVFAR